MSPLLRRTLLPATPLVAMALAALTSAPRTARAESPTDQAERAERCASRLFISLTGDGASPEALASPAPQSLVDGLLADPRFVEHFARFVNARFNNGPGNAPVDDGAYTLAKHVLTNDKPWSDMFLGAYDIVPSDPNVPTSAAVVKESADGLGYFRTRAWSLRYAGNEQDGIRLVAAYRILTNTVGVSITPVTAPPGDTSVKGRQAPDCAGCHYSPWFALDKVASVLGKRVGTGDTARFEPSTLGPQVILDGRKIADDKELVQALVASENFDVNACRIAFRFLYGREDNACEGRLLDSCVAAFKDKKRITAALATIAKDASFCE